MTTAQSMTATAKPEHRSPVDPAATVVNATNADLRAELDYRNADTGEAAQRRYQKYAVRFVLDAAPGEDATAANLARILGGCVRPPRPFEYPAIRMHVDTYRMAQMSAADAARDRLREIADWYEGRAAAFGEKAAFWHRHFAGELRKIADSL